MKKSFRGLLEDLRDCLVNVALAEHYGDGDAHHVQPGAGAGLLRWRHNVGDEARIRAGRPVPSELQMQYRKAIKHDAAARSERDQQGKCGATAGNAHDQKQAPPPARAAPAIRQRAGQRCDQKCDESAQGSDGSRHAFPVRRRSAQNRCDLVGNQNR